MELQTGSMGVVTALHVIKFIETAAVGQTAGLELLGPWTTTPLGGSGREILDWRPRTYAPKRYNTSYCAPCQVA